jgi:hypothetical protein
VDDQPIFVAANVEDHAVVTDEIDIRAEHRLDVGRPRSLRFKDGRVPYAQGYSRLRVALPKCTKRGFGDHLHMKTLFPIREHVNILNPPADSCQSGGENTRMS